jgi:hypothetical protein
MSIPLSFSDLWKVFEWVNGRAARNKAAVVEWLESVRTDLEDLSKVWLQICGTLESANEDERIREALDIINRGCGMEQSAYSGRLSAFYQYSSRVLGRKDTSDFHKDFIDKLGNLLYKRFEARRILDKELPMQTLAAEESVHETLLRMREQVVAIQQQVADLQVLIKTFKAQQ